MAKSRINYICENCGYESSGWLGKCPSCSAWNTFAEHIDRPVEKKPTQSITLTRLGEIEAESAVRINTGINELNRVLGGGLVKGSIVLVGGDPGIGKSTILLQLCKEAETEDIIYISGEESLGQISIRAGRLGVKPDGLRLASETDLDAIVSCLQEEKPAIAVIDSIQTVYSSSMQSVPGSVSQIRNSTLLFMEIAKKYNIAIFLVGHVTKDGSLAGPRVLEHMVDTVLYFEGDRSNNFRILRSVKNRFGSTNEIGVFRMNNSGLEEVLNPSEFLLSGRNKGAAGSCIIPAIEGTRPMLVEIQALVRHTPMPVPRRLATGIDQKRSTMIVGVLEKVVGYKIDNCDIYMNAAGGIKVIEPACDLALACAIASSYKARPLDSSTVVMGEIGLTGEVRGVSGIEKRIIEAEKMGFEFAVVPVENAKAASQASKEIEILPVKDAAGAIKIVMK